MKLSLEIKIGLFFILSLLLFGAMLELSLIHISEPTRPY